MPKRVQHAKIACLDFSLQKAKMKMGVHVIVDDPEKLQGKLKVDFCQFKVSIKFN